MKKGYRFDILSLFNIFIRRFLLHALPKRFVRIRHFGFLANRYKTDNLVRLRCLLGPLPGMHEAAEQTLREMMLMLTGIDLTGWLEYFVEGLSTQLAEVRERGEQAIRRDVLVKEHRLSDRQAKALGHILEHGSLTIQDFEGLCPDVNRRSLQRDLKAMVDRGLIVSEGETHRLLYRLAKPR